MSFEFDNNKPIYLQLVDIIKLKIISKELKPGSKLSSVRDMAQEFGVILCNGHYLNLKEKIFYTAKEQVEGL